MWLWEAQSEHGRGSFIDRNEWLNFFYGRERDGREGGGQRGRASLRSRDEWLQGFFFAQGRGERKQAGEGEAVLCYILEAALTLPVHFAFADWSADGMGTWDGKGTWGNMGTC